MQELLNTLTLIGAVQGIFFSLVLLGLPGRNRVSNRFLAAFLLVFSICMMGIVAYASRWVLKFPHLGLLHTPFGAIQGIPFFLYLLSLSKKDFRMNWKLWSLFLPFLIVAVWLIPFYALGAEAKRQVLESGYQTLPRQWLYLFIFSTIVNAASILASFVVVLRHERLIRQVYSSSSNKTLLWTRHFLYACTGVFLTCVFMSFFDVTWADAFSNLCFCVVIYVFGYRAMRQPEIFRDISEDALPVEEELPLMRRPVKYEKSGLTEEKAKALLERMERLMLEEKPYLDPALNLQQLAAQLQIVPHQLSQLLNQFKGESFSDFVNRYRVEHFKRIALSPSHAHLSLLGIAFESGFNSKAAFNAAFKRLTGQTPSEFVRNLKA